MLPRAIAVARRTSFDWAPVTSSSGGRTAGSAIRPSAVTIAMRAEISVLGRAFRLSIKDMRIGLVAFGSGTP